MLTLFLLLLLLLSGRTSGYDGVLPAGPDMAQFKQGVKTVAGKMAVLANGVMNTIQVRLQTLRFPDGCRLLKGASFSGSLRLLLSGSPPRGRTRPQAIHRPPDWPACTGGKSSIGSRSRLLPRQTELYFPK